MLLKKITICLLVLINAFLLISCRNNSVNANTENDIEEINETVVAEGSDILGGSWTVGGIFYKNHIIDIEDVSALESMYDGVVLTFNQDGTFVYIDRYNYKGIYIKYEQEEEEYYLLKANTVSRYTLQNGMITETDEKETQRTFIIKLLDEDTTFKLCDFDSISGKVEADDSQLIFMKDYSDEYIKENKTEIKTEENNDNIQNNSSNNDYTKPSTSTHKENVSSGKRNALEAAKNYLSVMAFSYNGLIEQLEFEGYTTEEATYGVDNCGANWNEQAVKKAEEYLNVMPFSYSELVDQLEFEGFTNSQAEYGVSQAY